MGLMSFLKDKLLFIVLNIVVAAFSAFLLYWVNSHIYFISFVPFSYIAGCVIIIAIEFLIKNSYYKKLLYTLDNLDKKTLLYELAPDPVFYEARILTEILKETNKAMNDDIAKYSMSTAEYREYIEIWVHDIKTPIAGAKLICENMQSQAITNELDRIEKLVEQALFYCRSGSVEKDFLVKQVMLKDIVNSLLRKNARRLIEQKIQVETDNLELSVYTDVKWIDFILGQILDNSMKYESKKITINTRQNLNSLSLLITDDGIGIDVKDIKRVFDKGFTGENGRKYAKSTGIGLYLCKKLSLKLGLNISIISQKNKTTTVEIIFPKSDMYTN